MVPLPEISRRLALQLGPLIESHALFPQRANVQLLKILNRNNIRIEIWERGAGYTLASGTSSAAAAAVAHKMGEVDAELTVHMPGGKIKIHIGDDYAVTMSGSATRVAEMEIDNEALRWPLPDKQN